jgi:L-alanine-DL-glutamate epimerase-like enolase superfamily enzyme
MKIESLKISPLNLIPQVALSVSYGTYEQLEYALLQIQTDNGLTGLGEASPDPEVTGETQESTLRVLSAFSELLIGRDPHQFRAILSELRTAFPDAPAALAAVDMALLDLIGQAHHLPVYQWLGGLSRTAIPLYPVIPMDSPEAMAALAQGFKDMGAKAMKIKLGSDPETDVARVTAISEIIGPDIVLRPDINQGWQDAETALAAIQSLANFNIEWIEQPVAADDFAAMAEVCANTTMPIMADESCHSAADALKLIEMKAADIINIKLMKCGGLLGAEAILAVANAADIPCILGSMGESGIGSAAGMHLIAAHPEIIACELIGPLFLEGDPSQGFMADLATVSLLVPEGPGLGVTLK